MTKGRWRFDLSATIRSGYRTPSPLVFNMDTDVDDYIISYTPDMPYVAFNLIVCLQNCLWPHRGQV